MMPLREMVGVCVSQGDFPDEEHTIKKKKKNPITNSLTMNVLLKAAEKKQNVLPRFRSFGDIALDFAGE